MFSEYDWESHLLLESGVDWKTVDDRNRYLIYLFQEQKDFMKEWKQWKYREKIMLQGFYIGHHFGVPTYFKLFDRAMVFVTADPNRIIWSFAIKFILTINSIQHNWLHLKTGAIEWNGKAILLMGRGEQVKRF